VKDSLENKAYRVVKGGDGWRVAGVLLPLEIAKEKCSRVLQLI
jgi:hypothetical protein